MRISSRPGCCAIPCSRSCSPSGPSSSNGRCSFPFDVLWQRPRRVAAAQLNAQAVGERLVWDALTLVAQTRTAHADAVIADRRLQLTIEIADLVQRLTDITEARLRAGDISELEARSARSDAARVQVVRRAVEHDRNLARLTLAGLLGLDTPVDQLQPDPGRRSSTRPRAEPRRLDSRTRSRRAPTCAPPRSASKPRRSGRDGSALEC